MRSKPTRSTLRSSLSLCRPSRHLFIRSTSQQVDCDVIGQWGAVAYIHPWRHWWRHWVDGGPSRSVSRCGHYSHIFHGIVRLFGARPSINGITASSLTASAGAWRRRARVNRREIGLWQASVVRAQITSTADRISRHQILPTLVFGGGSSSELMAPAKDTSLLTRFVICCLSITTTSLKLVGNYSCKRPSRPYFRPVANRLQTSFQLGADDLVANLITSWRQIVQ